MAGDWIKLQKDTPDKPEVLAIASRLGLDPDAVVGKLVRVWSWFDTHTTDGNAECVTFSFVDRHAGVTGFAEQMALVGWLIQKGHTLSLPNFDYHTGETAKKRALGKNRTEKHRSNAEGNADSNASIVTKTSPEKRREEKNSSSLRSEEKTASRSQAVACPPDVNTAVWDDWLKLRKSKKAPVTQTVVDGAIDEAKKAGLSLTDFLKVWCIRGSQGLQADWLKPHERGSPPGQAETPYQRSMRLRVAEFAPGLAKAAPEPAAPPKPIMEIFDVTPRVLG